MSVPLVSTVAGWPIYLHCSTCICNNLLTLSLTPNRKRLTKHKQNWGSEWNKIKSKHQRKEKSLIKLMMISGNEDKAKPQLAYVCASNSNSLECCSCSSWSYSCSWWCSNTRKYCTAVKRAASSLAPLHYPNKRKAEMTRRLITSLVGVPLLAGTSSCPLIGCLALPLSLFYSLLDVQLLRSTKHWRTWTWGTNHKHLQHTEYTNLTEVGTLQGKA